MSTPEGIVKSEVTAALDALGIWYLRMQSGVIKKSSRYIHLHPTGTADLLVFLPRRVIWIELKVVGQKTAKDRAQKQLDFRNRVLAAGHEHSICHSVEEVLQVIGGLPEVTNNSAQLEKV